MIINSHTHGEYLSDPTFWDISEAAEAHDTPIYLHPNTLPASMIAPFLACGLDGAIFGFGVETGMHALRIITAGVCDRFPKLQMILGHMGEALPFWAALLPDQCRDSVPPQVTSTGRGGVTAFDLESLRDCYSHQYARWDCGGRIPQAV